MVMYSKISQRRFFYGNRKYVFNGLIPMSRHGILLWRTVEATNMHVNQSVMPETNTFPRLITSDVVSVKKCAQVNRNCSVWGILVQKFKKSDT